jgi:hypothetical protein
MSSGSRASYWGSNGRALWTRSMLLRATRYADMSVYRGPKPQGRAVKLGRLLRGAIESYGGPSAPLSQRRSDALNDCDNLL